MATLVIFAALFYLLTHALQFRMRGDQGRRLPVSTWLPPLLALVGLVLWLFAVLGFVTLPMALRS